MLSQSVRFAEAKSNIERAVQLLPRGNSLRADAEAQLERRNRMLLDNGNPLK